MTYDDDLKLLGAALASHRSALQVAAGAPSVQHTAAILRQIERMTVMWAMDSIRYGDDGLRSFEQLTAMPNAARRLFGFTAFADREELFRATIALMEAQGYAV